MAKRSRGRRAVAEQLGLLNQDADDVRTGNKKTKGTSPGRRTKLPSDRTILGAMVRRIFRWIFRIAVAFFVISVGLTLLYRFVDPPLTPLMLIRPIEGIAAGNLVWIDKEWISIDKVDRDLLRSVIASEDARFFTHDGIDWKALEAARAYNERQKGKKIRGASTISNQCARNAFLWLGRNYIRKGLEWYFTYLMEFIWGKKRILEVYINIIEWGDGIYGVEAAAQEYFGVSAADLTPRQAALLTAVLPNPRRWSPAHPTAYINKRAATIQSRARSIGLKELNLPQKDKK